MLARGAGTPVWPGAKMIAVAGLLVLAGCGGAGDQSAGEPGAGDAAAPGSMTATGEGDRQTGARPGGARFGFGTPATASQIAAWDIDIAPDGAGLPPGRGTVADGLALWDKLCLACHGPTGREGPFDVVAGRVPGDAFPFANDPAVRSTVGNYWPYATTLFDYTRRAMPFDAPGSLTDDEVYALVAAMLFFNDLLPEDAVADSATVVDTMMPARDRFVRDDRTGGPETR